MQTSTCFYDGCLALNGIAEASVTLSIMFGYLLLFGSTVSTAVGFYKRRNHGKGWCYVSCMLLIWFAFMLNPIAALSPISAAGADDPDVVRLMSKFRWMAACWFAVTLATIKITIMIVVGKLPDRHYDSL